MAIAERHLAAVFGGDIVDHTTYVLASDGDLMEGISQEAIALAGHLKLKKLIVLFDDNGISIDGPLTLANSVDQVKRFESAGWAATRIDGHDPAAIAAALEAAQGVRPALADRLPHHHRLRRAEQRPAAKKATARRSAPKRSPRARAEARLERAAFEIPADIRDAMARGRRARQAGASRLGRCASPRSIAEKRAEFERRTRGDSASALAAAVAK